MGVILDERKIMKLKINGAPRNILNNILGKHPFIDRGKINFYSPELILTFSQKSQWGRPPGMVGGGQEDYYSTQRERSYLSTCSQ